MNAVLYKLTRSADTSGINMICSYLQERDFADAEIYALDLLEEIIRKEYNTVNDIAPSLSFVSILYTTINSYYMKWAKIHGINPDQEMKQLRSAEHDNIFVEHTSDPDSMEDLLYEVMMYLSDVENDTQLAEARYHLSCYKRTQD